MGKNSGNMKSETMKKRPAAWRVETTPKIGTKPNNANYYKRTYTSPTMKRHVWQYMFGGILRAIFGIYSNNRYWNVDKEAQLKEDLREEYEISKANRTYGIYCFEVTRGCTVWGKPWINEQKPKFITKQRSFWLRSGGIIYARINHLDVSKGIVDVEFKPITFGARKRSITVVSMPLKAFHGLLKDNRLRRLRDDGKLYKIKSQRAGKQSGKRPQ